jgi:hypothetical protein
VRSISSAAGRRSIVAAAVALVALSPVARAGSPATHPNPEPIAVKVDDGFHWGDAGIGAAAGVGAALIVAGGLAIGRGGDEAGIHSSNHKEAEQ